MAYTQAQMTTQVQVSVEDYLGTSYPDGDREYVDGEIVERPLSNFFHGEAQAGFAWAFKEAGRRHPIYVCTETRMRVSSSHIRIPDVAIFLERPESAVPVDPPLLVVEILSPADVWSTVLQKCAEYEAWGVRHIWLADVTTHELRVYQSSDIRKVDALALPEYDIRVTPDDLF